MLERLSSLEHHSTERLAARRRRNHFHVLIALGFIFCALFAAVVYGLWQGPVRVSHVTVYGGDQSLAEIATKVMQGSYLGIIPRDSIFFLPETHIRSEIIAEHSDIAAISIFRSGLTGLSIKVNDRVPVARWCPSTGSEQGGASPVATSSSLMTGCYAFDANGFVYKTTDVVSALNPFIIYESLATSTASGQEISPVGSTLPNAEKFPPAFEFARQLGTLGSPVVSIAFRGDEVDDYLKSGTRVTYVLGNEKNAFTALSSARSSINLANSSLEYVDLRFDGKVYLKKKGKAQ